jgi:tetratricopeptide (TPR) repeat protein
LLLAFVSLLEGKPDEALEHVRADLEKTAGNPESACSSFCALCAIESARGDLAAAERAARRALELAERRYTYQALGRVLAAQGRWEEAAEAYRKSLAAEMPPRSTPAGLLAGSLLELGRYEEAVAECEKAVAFSPQNSPVHENLARALWKLGRTKDALAAAARGIERVPDRPRLWVVRGEILSEEGRRDEAARSFAQALELDPENSAARQALARLPRG